LIARDALLHEPRVPTYCPYVGLVYSRDTLDQRHHVIFAREEYARLLGAVLPAHHVRVTSRAEFARAIAKRGPVVGFVDLELLPQIDMLPAGVTIVGVTRGGVAELVDAILSFPNLSNVISTTMLTSPSAAANIAALCARIDHGSEHRVLGSNGVGRAALLACSERRAQRIDRIAEFFASRGVQPRTITMMTDVAEELITNALYDAPHEAGWFRTPVPRTVPVDMPPEHACEISYGVEDGSVFMRVRDPFGALTHQRLLHVLARCRHKDVQFDESRGGAGLGMWRLFSAASTIVISVIAGRLTDVLVWIDAGNRRASGKLHTVQLSFPDQLELDGVFGRFAADHDFDLMDDSFTALIS